MDSIQQAIEYDLKNLPNVRFKNLPPATFFNGIFARGVMLSLLFLGLIFITRFIMKSIGLYQGEVTWEIFLVTWGACFLSSLFISLPISRVRIVTQMSSGLFKTAPFLKKKIKQYSYHLICTYLILFALVNFLCDYFMGAAQASSDPDFVLIMTPVAHLVCAFIAFFTTYFYAMIDLERCSLAPILNVIGELIARKQHSRTEL